MWWYDANREKDKLCYYRGWCRKVGRNGGELGTKPGTRTQNKAKRTNKIDFVATLCKQGVAGSIPASSTNHPNANQSLSNLAVARLRQFGSIWVQLKASPLPQPLGVAPLESRADKSVA